MAVLTAAGTFRTLEQKPTTDVAGPLLTVTTALPSLLTHTDPRDPRFLHPNLGRLLTPRHYSSVERMADAGVAWAADNDGFNGVDFPRWMAMLDAIKGYDGCRFVTVPDVLRCSVCDAEVVDCGCESKARPVYGDAVRTAEEFAKWAPAVERRGLPVALVLQDGLETPAMQRWLAGTWHRLDAVFVGGSNDFKLGPDAAAICREAKARGKWVHWGRVNSEKRIRHCMATGACDSIDGTKWARWRKTHLDNGLEAVRRTWEAQELPLLDVDELVFG